MHPTLFTIGNWPVSSFGLFLALGIFSSLFVIWRNVHFYDLPEEKIIDLALLALLAGILGARLYFVALSWPLYNSLEKIVLINRFPGLSFWGGAAFALVIFSLLCRRLKIHFWQIADISLVGLILGLSWGDFGCFLNGCFVGKVSASWFALPVTGILGKRIPIQIAEGLAFFLLYLYLQKEQLRFHFAGKTTALFLIFFAIIKFITDYFRADYLVFYKLNFSKTQLLSGVFFILGLITYYLKSKRNLKADFFSFLELLSSRKRQKATLLSMRKFCYNHWISLRVGLTILKKNVLILPRKLRRILHVKPTPTDSL